MDVIEAARKVGAALQQDERYIEYAKAKLAFDKDEELGKRIGEFNLVKMNLDTLMAKEEKDEKEIGELNAKLRSIYSDVMNNETMKTFTKASSTVDKMLHDINSIIVMCADGEDPETCELHDENCTGHCSTCGGCH